MSGKRRRRIRRRARVARRLIIRARITPLCIVAAAAILGEAFAGKGFHFITWREIERTW